MGKTTGFLEYDRKPSECIPALERIKNFEEFHLLLSGAGRKEQAARCMNCGIPFCQSGVSYSGSVSGCPLHNLIPEYNEEIYQGNWEQALLRLTKTNNFPEFTGRVCPALCENACVCAIFGEPVTTHDNELAVIEEAFARGLVKPRIPAVRSGKKVAVIGSGPSGLAAADCLNQRGHTVTVFERADRPGGLLMYGIPGMKLDKKVVKRRTDLMLSEGITFRLGMEVGRDISADEIISEYDAVILCGGAGKARDVDVPGRDAEGVVMAVDFLTRSTRTLLDGEKPSEAKDKHVVVVGGGDTGNDCVGTAIRQGCASIVQLDRNPKAPESCIRGGSWPLKPHIYSPGYGQEEAIALFGADPRMFSGTVKEIIKDGSGHVERIVTVEIRKSVDKNGKRKITQVPGTEQEIPCDLLILAAGFAGCEDSLAEAFGAARTPAGTLRADEKSYMTSVPGVFAAGDARRGASLVVWAIAEGRECARAVDLYLMDYSNMSC